MPITRNPADASGKRYDLIILGGGIYGVMLTLEASLRGYSALLLEKDDFGGSTSYNSLRIIHGGLRYLQTLNLKRYREFVAERRWFLAHFPDMVQPLPVLMPLYQQGLRRTGIFRMAFFLDHLLSHRQNYGLPTESALPRGRVLSPKEVREHFPAVDSRDLKGGALWYDACVPDSQRLIMDVLRCACSLGATVLNYMPATDLLQAQRRVAGVHARDVVQDAYYDFYSGVVVNATGPWSRENARRFDKDIPALFRHSIAWNVLFDREALSASALGVAPPKSRGHIYFLHPWKGRLLIGTGHAPRTSRQDHPLPTREEMRLFMDDLNAAIPGLAVTHRDILHVFAGFIPVQADGTLRFTRNDYIVDHATHQGPAGLYSIGGTKFTAARSTAEAVLKQVFPDHTAAMSLEEALRKTRRERAANSGRFDYHWFPNGSESTWHVPLRRIIEEEAVCHLDDLVLRRTTLGDNPARARAIAPLLCDLFDWSTHRREEEMQRLEFHFRWMPTSNET